MKIKNILTLSFITLAAGLVNMLTSVPQKKYFAAAGVACPANPALRNDECPNYCSKAERAADRRIDTYQDPLLAEQLEEEYLRLKELCERQNPAHHFTEENALAQQEMPHVD